MSSVISQLYIHPVKSCAGISVDSVVLDERGPVNDRRWMVVDEASRSFYTQRKNPLMTKIIPQISENGRVSVSCEMMPGALVLPVSGDQTEVTVWSDHVRGIDCGDEAAAWFSEALGVSCRLVYQGDCERYADTGYAPDQTSVSFADGFPLLVTNEATFRFLDEDCPGYSIGSNRFRPNVVVSGPEAFAEETWKTLRTDNIEMTVVKPCQRCVIPSIDPATAEKQRDVMSVLIRHCRKENGKVYLGQNAVFSVTGEAVLRVGDLVSIEA